VKVLVTGGCGFIGQHLVERLSSISMVSSIWVLDSLDHVATGKERVSNLAKLVVGNVCDADLVDNLLRQKNASGTPAKPFDLVMHLAAQSHVDASLKDSQTTMYVNAVGTQVVASACSYHNVPMLYCSTDEVYGPANITDNGKVEEKDESHALMPSSPYSAGKAAGELAVRAEGRSFGLRFVITRGCNAFGPNQYPEKLIPIACRLLQRGEAVPLHGGGGQIRQWVHVEEFAEALLRIGMKLVGGSLDHDTYNIAGPRRASVSETVRELSAHCGWGKHFHKATGFPTANRPGQDEAYAVNGDRFEIEFCWMPKRDLFDPAELEALVNSYNPEGDVVLARYANSATA
jgi:dTDP-glucose 4,6-dehydratase